MREAINELGEELDDIINHILTTPEGCVFGVGYTIVFLMLVGAEIWILFVR
jgi:hypothetical protein